MAWGAAIAAVGAIAASQGGGGGGNGTQRAAQVQRQNLQDILDRLDQVEVPDAEDMQLALEEFESQGKIDPILADAIKQDPTAFNIISEDPELGEQQRATLDRLTEISRQGGMDAQMREALTESTLQAESEARGQRDALRQRALSSGTLGSGQDLAMRQMANQASAQRASQRGVSAAAEAERRAMDALLQRGQLAGNIRQQEWGQQSEVAQARDAIARFNAQQKAQTQERNIGRQMSAQQQNLSEQQRLHERNVEQRNVEEERRAQMPADIYGMEMSKARGATSAMQTAGSNISQLYANQQPAPDRTGQMMQMLGQIGGSYYASQSDEDTKKNIEDMSPDQMDELLADLSGSKYQYRRGALSDDGGKMHAGVMAEDMNKSKMGDKMTKKLDSGSEAITADLSTLMALLGHVNDKAERANQNNNSKAEQK